MILLALVFALGFALAVAILMTFRWSMRVPCAQSKPRCKEPAVFAGKSSDFREWLFSVDEALQALQPRDSVSYVASCLEGSARHWLMNSWEDEGRPENWQVFRARLCRAFTFEYEEENSRQLLLQTSQTGGLEEYINLFSSRCLSARKMDDLTKVLLFVKGLADVRVESEVRRQHPTTLAEAVRAARTASHFERDFSSVRDQNCELREVSDTAARRARLLRPRMRSPRLSEAERRRLLSEGRCFRCKELGHLARDCHAVDPNSRRQ